MDMLRIEACADYLSECRSRGLRRDGLPADLAPRDLEEAYRMQLAISQRRGPTAGFKIGLTKAEAQRAAGIAAPIVGRLVAHDLLRNGERIEVGRDHLRVAEAEVVFEMGEDLPSTDTPFSQERIARSVSAAFAGLEICDSRYSNVDAAPLTDVVADNSNADLLVIGGRLTDADMQSLANLPVTLSLTGQAPVHGSTANVLGHPLVALTWLANWLAAQGDGLKRGQLIASGSCTGMTEFASRDIIAATFGANTRVAVEVTPGSQET